MPGKHMPKLTRTWDKCIKSGIDVPCRVGMAEKFSDVLPPASEARSRVGSSGVLTCQSLPASAVDEAGKPCVMREVVPKTNMISQTGVSDMCVWYLLHRLSCVNNDPSCIAF